MKVKHGKTTLDGKLEDDYILNLIPESEYQSLYNSNPSEEEVSDSNFEDNIKIVEIDLETG